MLCVETLPPQTLPSPQQAQQCLNSLEPLISWICLRSLCAIVRPHSVGTVLCPPVTVFARDFRVLANPPSWKTTPTHPLLTCVLSTTFSALMVEGSAGVRPCIALMWGGPTRGPPRELSTGPGLSTGQGGSGPASTSYYAAGHAKWGVGVGGPAKTAISKVIIFKGFSPPPCGSSESLDLRRALRRFAFLVGLSTGNPPKIWTFTTWNRTRNRTRTPSDQSFSDRSFWKSLRVVDVRAFGPWMCAPRSLFFQDFDSPDRSFGPGYLRE